MLREDYYLGHIGVKDLGIAMPKALAKKINPRVDWPKKAVHALADRSVFNGFTADDEAVTMQLRDICADNQLEALYRKNLIGELKHAAASGLSRTAAASPSSQRTRQPQRRRSGTTRRSASRPVSLWPSRRRCQATPSACRPSCTCSRRTRWWCLRAAAATGWPTTWSTGMGRCLMEPMPYDATLERPFGSSRISRSVMSITDDAIRQRARMEVASESATRRRLGCSAPYKKMINGQNKYDSVDGLRSTRSPKTLTETRRPCGSRPSCRWPRLTEYLRQLACQMSAVTNVPVSFFGVSNDNPSSSDAIAASLEPLVIDAKNLNRENGNALRNVAYMALAVANGTDYETERDAGYNLNPRFMSPAYPSIVSLSDAALKQVQGLPKLANSDVMLEMLDYTDEQIQRINSDNKKAQANAAVASLFEPKEGEDGGDTSQPA